MSMGMSPYEYWYENPQLVKTYQRAYDLKIEQENERMWLQGLYNYKAFSSVMSQFGYALGGGKGAKPEEYFEFPIAITEREKQAEKQRNIDRTLAWLMKGQQDG